MKINKTGLFASPTTEYISDEEETLYLENIEKFLSTRLKEARDNNIDKILISFGSRPLKIVEKHLDKLNIKYSLSDCFICGWLIFERNKNMLSEGMLVSDYYSLFSNSETDI